MKQKPDEFGYGARFEQFDQVISKAGDWIKQKSVGKVMLAHSCLLWFGVLLDKYHY